MSHLVYPPWVVLHVPHDSVDVPPEVRNQISLDDHQLAEEFRRVTDHMTLALFAHPTRGAKPLPRLDGLMDEIAVWIRRQSIFGSCDTDSTGLTFNKKNK
jgi:hypothetical protein